MSDNNEILANFQSITAIDDVGEAIMHLEECNWDLYAAIHRVLPQDNSIVSPPPQFVAATTAMHQASRQQLERELNNLDGVPDALLGADVPPPFALGFRNIYVPDLSTTSNSNGPIDMINEYARNSNARSASSSTSAEVSPAASSSSSSRNRTQSTNHRPPAPKATLSATAVSFVPSASTTSTGSGTSGSGGRVSRIKDVLFNIHHKYTVHTIRISNQSTVGDLKKRIAAATQVPVCRQALTGWLPADQAYTNQTVLRTLNLAIQNDLILADTTADGVAAGAATSSDVAARQLETFTIHIHQMPNNEHLMLNFPGTQTLIQVKTDVYSITDIPVRHQQWTGWPAGMTNDTTLAAATGVGLSHAVMLRSSTGAVVTASASHVVPDDSNIASGSGNEATSGSSNTSNVNVIEIDSDDSEFEDATDADFNGDEDMFSEPIVRNRVTHLIEDNIDDEKMGSMQFVENYVQRYGSPHPEFFIGSLEEAMLSACQKPASQRKLLAIYLHDDRSVLTNVFCDQLLKCDSVMQTLQHNFVLFGWDLTHESNKHMFLSSLSCVGVTATMHVRSLLVSQLPTILIVGKSRSTHEVLSIIHGNVSRDELLNKLIDTMNMYGEQRDVEVREENERAAREAVKMEQDEAYQESLDADRRKEETKREREREEASERQRVATEERETAELREAARQSAEAAVLPEPAVGTAGCTKIRVRQPSGVHFERRFAGASPLHQLLMFVASMGFPLNEYKVISSYPRRDLTTLDDNETLSHYKLCPQETVILEER